MTLRILCFRNSKFIRDYLILILITKSNYKRNTKNCEIHYLTDKGFSGLQPKNLGKKNC